MQQKNQAPEHWVSWKTSLSFCWYMGVSKNKGTPKSSILIRCSIINHSFWGTLIFGNTHMYMICFERLVFSQCTHTNIHTMFCFSGSCVFSIQLLPVKKQHIFAQIIATSQDLTPNGGFVWEGG